MSAEWNAPLTLRRMARFAPASFASAIGSDMRCQPVAGDRPHCGAMGEKRGLRIVRQRELVGGTIEAERRESSAVFVSQRGIRRVEHLACRGERLVQVLPHSGFLRS